MSMKTFTLHQFGKSWVLQNNQTVHKANFKSLEALSYHINRYGLLFEIEGLNQLPKYYQKQIGYDGIQPISDVISDILMGSGFTNPSLIS